MRRVLRWIGWSIGAVVAALIVAMLATARSGDAALYPPSAENPRVEVFVLSHGYHAGIVVPRSALVEAARRKALPALTAMAARFADYPRLEIGWGDEGFYRYVPTLDSLSVTMALRALFMPGNPSVLHVVGLAAHPRATFAHADMVVIELGDDGFERLATMIDATLARRDGAIEELGPGLYGASLFFRAVGAFSLLRVCNHWIAELLDAAGVPTTPVLATLSQGLLWDLSWRAGAIRVASTSR